MNKLKTLKRAALGTAIAAAIGAGLGVPLGAPAAAQPFGAVKPTSDVALSMGTGRLVQLGGNMTDLFVANEGIADVQVRSANQIYIFGKAAGETTVYATNKAGKVIYSATVRVGTNIGTVDEMLALAMPDAQLRATSMNGMLLLTGTVAAPADVEEAGRLVQAFVGEGTQVISRLKTATPLQVMLKVKIVEVSRSLTREIGVNLLSRDRSGGFLFGIGRGTPGSITTNPGSVDPLTGLPSGPYNAADGVPGASRYTFNNKVGATTLGAAGSLLGFDLLASLDLAENSGRVTTLAEPTLVALSGETASFLAGGEFPIAASNGINGTTVEFKEYGVSLAFTPIVLDGGRISMRVRPEVSELTSDGAIKLNGFEIPALSTRRAETTVELGSGQSFMIGGLLRNASNNAIEKAPFLGDIPILGALFRSTSFRRNESELLIVVTPYLVKPVNASQIALPSDGYRVPTEPARLLGDVRHNGVSGEQRPGPRAISPTTVGPGIQSGAVIAPSLPAAVAPAQQAGTGMARPSRASASPGFSF